MRSPTPLDMVRRRWPEGTPETPAPAPRPESPPDRMLSAQRRCSQKRRAIEILLGPQLGGDRSILRGEWCRNSQPRTASRSPSPTCHARTLPTLRNKPSPLPHTPAPGPTKPGQELHDRANTACAHNTVLVPGQLPHPDDGRGGRASQNAKKRLSTEQRSQTLQLFATLAPHRVLTDAA